MVRSSRSRSTFDGTVKRPRSASVASGVPGTTVTVSAEKNSGSIAVTSRAVPSACSRLRSMPMPSSAMTLNAMPAACARRAASTWAAESSPLAMRFSVASSPDSGPMYSSDNPRARSVRSSSSDFARTFRAIA